MDAQVRRRSGLPSRKTIEPAVALFSALAHPLRLMLLVALSRRGLLSAGDLQELVSAEQSTVSHQLATLRRHNLIAVERNGRRMMYRLLDEHVAHIVEDAIKHANERR